MDTDIAPATDAVSTAPPLLTRKEVEHDILDVLGVDRADVSDDADLLDLGLDSIRAMYLVDKWQAQGVDIQFLELAEESTINAWWKAVEDKMAEQAEASN